MSEAGSKKGWQRRRFDEMAVIVNDRIDNPSEAGVDRYVGLEHLDSDSLTIRRWGLPSDVEATKLLFRKGDIILGRRRVYQKKLAVADFDGICSAHAMVLRARPEVVLDEFLPFFMQSDLFMERAKEISVGSLSPTINWKTLASQEFELPPIEEQLRLANALVAGEDYLSSVGELMQALTNTASALLERFLEGENGWPLESVHSLLSEPPKNGISPSGNDDCRGLRTVSISSVKKGLFDPTDCIKHADIDFNRAEPYFVRKGDTFVIRGNGNRSLVGRAGLCATSFDDLFYPDLLIRLRFDPAKMLPRFAVAQWNLPSSHARLAARAKSSNGIWKVNGQDIRAHSLRQPPIPEQERVLRDLDAIEHAIQGARERERTLREIKNVLLTTLTNDQ